MKLASIGAVSLALGVAISVPGLVAAGGFWVVAGGLAHALRERLGLVAKPAKGAEGERGGTYARGLLLMLAVGLPSLALGVFEVGFPEADRDWRFVPIAVGGLVVGLAVVSGGMMALGSGLVAAAEAVGVPEHPATITIRSVSQTGTYVNNQPRLEFELTVEPEGRPAYEVTKRATVPHIALGSIKPGDGFRALVDLDKPTAMEIDWTSPIPAADGGSDPSDRIAELEQLLREGKISREEFEQHRRRVLESI